jgi:flagellar hook-associated protein 3 FlgL
MRPTVSAGDGQHVAVGIVASANADVASTGSSTAGSYTRDILRALATLGSLSSSQISDSGFQQLVSDVHTSLGDAVTALNADAGVLGNRQTQLENTKTQLSDTATALQTQVSNTEDVDMASTLSNLSLVQTQLQASYQLISGLQSLSLTKYISSS